MAALNASLVRPKIKIITNMISWLIRLALMYLPAMILIEYLLKLKFITFDIYFYKDKNQRKTLMINIKQKSSVIGRFSQLFDKVLEHRHV